MVLYFCLELEVVEAKCKDLENRLKEKQEGEASSSQTLFSAETSDSRKPFCVRRLEKAWKSTRKTCFDGLALYSLPEPIERNPFIWFSIEFGLGSYR